MSPKSIEAVDKNILLPKKEAFERLVAPQAEPRKYDIKYLTVAVFLYGHTAAVYGLYLCFTSAQWKTIVLGITLAYLAGIGISAGAHRLWSHKAYKVKLPLEIIIMLLNSLAFQNTATSWVRDHRLHHLYADTDGDPHNATRGFFYSHIGWLLVKKHPEVMKRGKYLDMSDITNNPVLKFQKKYAIPLIGAVCFVLPTLAPVFLWSETYNNAWHITLLRYVYSLHLTFLVNSAAHLWGTRPYDKNIKSSNNSLVSVITLGDGFHNYHHVFPWDYRSSELGFDSWSLTTWFINFFAWIGWAYDLKSAPTGLVEMRSRRTGDGTSLAVNSKWNRH